MVKTGGFEGLIERLSESDNTIHFPKYLVKNHAKLLKPNEWSLYCLIETLQSEGKEVPQQTELAEMMGMTPRNIQVIISELKAKGMLETKIYRRENRTTYSFSNLKQKALEFEEKAL